ncbi:VCBS repeat-containing protein [Adhaeribacter rhizoryzae]|uniref:VCBS repeat-containing protein n=1 Tax=Adhaeribacter rhizoryzae TaxID=2607907 RepID=A0A5M6DNT3_9BACT|nr:VCBS repeat-containing protein [Adhaeribacter rhizoryzae]KAA5549138.1 VCBS repeat-containing protein [Adhaeribacter rhizoryzae]
MNRKFFAPFIFLVGMLSGCNLFKKEETLFTLLPPTATKVTFANNIAESDSFNILTFTYIYNGGGVAVGDVNNDGLQDLYFSGNMVSSKLYLNKGYFKFEDITAVAGVGTKVWATGVTMVDINQDGQLDIYVCTVNPVGSAQTPNLLFINQGSGKDGTPAFKEMAQAYGLDDTGYSTQAAFFDYDKDQDLDLYLLTNAFDNTNRTTPRPRQIKGEARSTDRLYRNNGDNTFTNVSKEAGILIEGWGLGVGISDINQDGWPDIYAANDFLSNDLLWINNQDGTFTNKASQYLKHQSYNSMGMDMADYNNDGLVDIMVVDMMPEDNLRQKTTMVAPNYDRFELNKRMGYDIQYVRNALQFNNGNGTFSEIGQLAGVYATDWSWAPLFADYDNDGLRDLFITNGFVKDVTDLDYIQYQNFASRFGTQELKKELLQEDFEKVQRVKIPNYIYQNQGDLSFKNKATEWGFATPSNSNGAAYADLDNDGDLDLVVNNINSEAFIYQNNANKLKQHHYLNLKLQGEAPNRGGIGATVKIKYQGQQQFYEHYLSRGFKSSVDNIIHFGLGKINRLDSLEITWPDGRYQLLKNIKVNQVLTLNQQQAKPINIKPQPALPPFFREVSAAHSLTYKHQEADYIDFKNQPLMPHKLTQNGPGLAVGDINNDGLDDFYIGGSGQRPGTLFYGQQNGSFRQKPLGNSSQAEDDMGVLFFDADNDGDLDLYVATGGNAFKAESENYRHRLYKNDGKGNFTPDPQALPRIVASGSCVTAADFDKDGDLDLFIGGRNNPRNYPLPGQSCILQNNGGTFTNVTKQVGAGLENIGMVTAALWTDFNQDNQPDLIVAGEWMPLSFFQNDKGVFKNVTASTGLNHTNGWWNSLVAGDFDNDGDIDYVAGNLGLNSRYKASPEQPVSLYAKDFDGNGNVDPILSYFIQGQNYPAAPRDALTDQIVSMRKRFPRYVDYGKTDFAGMLKPEELQDALVLKSYTFSSSYIQNNGNGKFSLKPLPVQAQFSPVYGMMAADYNQDGNLDLLLAGNSYAPETGMGYYDASYGTFLSGNGKGNFSPVSLKKSGFNVPGDAKSMACLVAAGNQPLMLVGVNKDSLKVFAGTPQATRSIIKLQPFDAYAELTFKNGQKRREEFYYGSGYLSQATRSLIANNLQSVFITDYAGKRREIKL